MYYEYDFKLKSEINLKPEIRIELISNLLVQEHLGRKPKWIYIVNWPQSPK